MGTTDDLFTSVASRLASAGLGTFNSDGTAYTSGQTAIVRNRLPITPDRAIALRILPASADTISPLATFLAQALIRGIPNSASDASNLTDEVRNSLLGLTEVWFGATHVLQIRFAGQIDLDPDESDRDQWSLKLLIDVDEAPTILRPEGGAWD